MVPLDRIVQFGMLMLVDPAPVIEPPLDNARRQGCPPVPAEVVVTSSAIEVPVIVTDDKSENILDRVSGTVC